VQLRRLEVDRLRNLRAVTLELPAGLTLVTGRNGQGKTSLLEAVYLLATGRSFRARKLEELVAWNGGPVRVAGTVARRTGEIRLGVVLDGPERRLLVDDRPRDLEGFLGWLDLVALPNERMAVLRGGPEERRRYLDRGLLGLDPGYLRRLGEYRRCLQQRNALLRAGGERSVEMASWEERLAEAAGSLHRSRRAYAVRVAAGMGEVGRALYPAGELLTLRYRPSPAKAADDEPGAYEGRLLEALHRTRGRDATFGYTGEGPHRDDLLVELDGADLRRFGSSGQVRLAVVALSLAQLRLLQEEKDEASLFLMDDFDSDLDDTRTSALATYLHDGGFQGLVATSKGDLAGRLPVPLRAIRVDDGTVHAV
jgi:DNA replication and repair protein RecF